MITDNQSVEVNRLLFARTSRAVPATLGAGYYMLFVVVVAAVLALIIWVVPARAGDVFFEAEISLRDASEEISTTCLESPLFGVTLVYEPASMHGQVALFARHTSSIPNTQDGTGLNELGLRTRFKLD